MKSTDLFENLQLITLDVDWASDDIINYTIDFLLEKNVKATWFVTHLSPAINRLKHYENFEIGIHPNFNPDSSHGNSVDEVFKYFKKNFPDAISFRPHMLLTSGPILHKANVEYNYSIDSSVFLFKTPNIIPHILPFNNQNPLYRFPYFWGDNFAFTYDNNNLKFSFSKIKGLKIYNFHPVHIAFNTCDVNFYSRLISKKHFTIASRDDIESLCNKSKYGICNFLVDLCSSINKTKQTFKLNELKNIWKNLNNYNN